MNPIVFIDALRKSRDPSLSDAKYFFNKVLPDMYHVDEIQAWVLRQDREFRLGLLNELVAAEAEARHCDIVRNGYPATNYAEECIRAAGRGHLLVGGI